MYTLYILLINILLSIVFISIPRAATYYVDNTSDCINKSAFGTEEIPFCTIDYGISQLNAGDELYVKNGTYNEVFNIDDLRASEGDPTIVSSYPGHRVIIRGRGYNSGRVRIRNCHWLVFKGLEITNTNHGILVYRESSNILISNNKVYDIGQEGIQIYDNSHHVQILNNTIYNNGHYNPSWGEGVYIGSGTKRTGDYTNNVIVKGNTIFDITAEAIEVKPRTYDVLIEDNLIYNCMTGKNKGSGGAIEVAPRCVKADCGPKKGDHIIRNNLVRDVIGECMIVDTSAEVYQNTISGCSLYGILIKDSDNFVRSVHHNRVNMEKNAIVIEGKPNIQIYENIGQIEYKKDKKTQIAVCDTITALANELLGGASIIGL